MAFLRGAEHALEASEETARFDEIREEGSLADTEHTFYGFAEAEELPAGGWSSDETQQEMG
jgi:hypothetical protein